ncbi:Uncharacterized protein FKW44_014300 [Caligus rogercresseyi]|uniref:Uncharacterized protein n=1 Tax=Caligus rogercresseyi TaxID=217165 RepID=A0A7T8JZU1_CALRO|nr:Uncharacterized protein FKW44_014300 [Caligus rogercresseyi]
MSSSKDLKAVVLYGFSKKKRKTLRKLEAIHLALLCAKAPISSRLMSGELLLREDLRGILISASPRYTTFNFKIPEQSGSSWNYAIDLVNFSWLNSYRYFSHLKKIVKQYFYYYKRKF